MLNLCSDNFFSWSQFQIMHMSHDFLVPVHGLNPGFTDIKVEIYRGGCLSEQKTLTFVRGSYSHPLTSRPTRAPDTLV